MQKTVRLLILFLMLLVLSACSAKQPQDFVVGTWAAEHKVNFTTSKYQPGDTQRIELTLYPGGTGKVSFKNISRANAAPIVKNATWEIADNQVLNITHDSKTGGFAIDMKNDRLLFFEENLIFQRVE